MRKDLLLLAAFSAVLALTAHAQAPAGTPHTVADVDSLLAKIATYQVGDSYESQAQVDQIIRESMAKPNLIRQIETRLLKFLQSDATPAAKEIAFRELYLVGTATAVPVLSPLLTNSETAEMARYALAAIPGPAADEALRNGLEQSSDRVKVGIINSLGVRGDARSVPALTGLISASNPAITEAAAAALARIATPAALDALAKAKGTIAGPPGERVAEAYVECADQFAARGDKAAASKAYRETIASREVPTVHIRALAGLTAVEGRNAVPALTTEMESKDPAVQAAAIRFLNRLPGRDITNVLMAEFPKLPPSGQMHTLGALTARGDAAARPLILTALQSSEPGVRVAALAALGVLGDDSSVMLLARTAADSRGPEQLAARQSLYAAPGRQVDGVIVSSIVAASGKVKAELIAAAGERAIATSADSVVKAVQDTDPAVHDEALRALKNVAGSAQVPALMELLSKGSTASDRRVVIQALASAIKKSQPMPIDLVLSKYNSTPDLTLRLGLIDVMGQVSSAGALPLLRNGTKDTNPEIARAAILALSNWDNPAPLVDLMDFAKNVPLNVEAKGPDTTSEQAGPGRGGQGRGRGGPPPTNNLQVLALRGVLNLVLTPSQRSPAESARLLAEVMGLAKQSAEKVRTLSLLPFFPCQESLEVAKVAERDQAVANEAQAAIAQVNEGLKLK